MTQYQRRIKKAADIFAIILVCGIFFGLINVVSILSSSFPFGRGDSSNEPIALQTELYDEDEIERLKLELVAATVEIKKGDSLMVEKNTSRIKLKQKGNRLIIEESGNFLTPDDEKRLVTVYVPEDFVFSQADFELGTSKINCEKLNCERFEAEVGAGKLNFQQLNVSGVSEIGCGAGELIIEDGELHNSAFELGVGKTDVRAALYGKADFESGIGQLDLTLKGGQALYSVNAEVGLGAFTVDGIRVESDTILGIGTNCINVEGGIGKVDVKFE